MVANNRRKPDLFDFSPRSGQPDLFDSRKRKADAMGSPGGRRFDRYDSAAPVKHPQSNVSLGALLFPDRLPPDKFHKIQSVLNRQDKKIKELNGDIEAGEEVLRYRSQQITQRNEEIGSLERRISSLKEENEGLREDKKRLSAGQASARQLRDSKNSLQQQVKERDEMLDLGSKIAKDMTNERDRLKEENARLHQTVSERDATVSKLNERVWKITSANADEHTAVALEVQAEQTLGLVNGLKKDVVLREQQIEQSSRQQQEAKAIIAQRDKANVQLQREVEGVKRELAKQKDAAEAASKLAAERGEVMMEQDALIKRIMEENKRLNGLV